MTMSRKTTLLTFLGIVLLAVGPGYGADKSEITHLAPPISEDGMYFGFSKKSPCSTLVNQIGRQLAELEKKDIPRKLLKKYLDGTRP
jgi:polar amino acid transport system substrate-binding protein